MTNEEYIELSNYVDLEGTEIGDYCLELLCLRDKNQDYGMSDEFSKALNVEMLLWLNKFRTETEITVRYESQPDKKITELKWHS